ncbi:MAG: 4'-phosphopantetheinyl transferase superfamily protein [Rubrivivax sp.]|nr:MAG: 4'-phosphopantetheinyl transferase superfamily protein [Rubrivivax sp.]
MPISSDITALPSPGGSDISLCLVDLDAHPDAWDASVLSADERARAARFRFEVHARRYQASHVALRQILGQATGSNPASLRFTEGLHGKPRLAQAGAPQFNMSHSAGWALVGWCPSHPLGVDIEIVTPMDDADLLAQRHFSATEYAAFGRTPPDHRLEAFFRCWTRKEACLKALGSGLSIEPCEFEAGMGQEDQRTFIAVAGQACHMRVGCIELSIPGQAAFARLDDADSPLAM